MAVFWRSVICLATISSSMAIFIGGEQDVGSPLRVAQCRATCLERVSFLNHNFCHQNRQLVLNKNQKLSREKYRNDFYCPLLEISILSKDGTFTQKFRNPIFFPTSSAAHLLAKISFLVVRNYPTCNLFDDKVSRSLIFSTLHVKRKIGDDGSVHHVLLEFKMEYSACDSRGGLCGWMFEGQFKIVTLNFQSVL